jgi:hypothetical protein
MRVPYLVAIAMCSLMSSKSYASRGWYVSIAGLSSKQKHETSDYTLQYTIPSTTTFGNQKTTLTFTSTQKPQFTTNALARVDLYIPSILSETSFSVLGMQLTLFKGLQKGDIVDARKLLLAMSDIFPAVTTLLNSEKTSDVASMFDTTNGRFWAIFTKDLGFVYDTSGNITRFDAVKLQTIYDRIGTSIADDPNINPNSNAIVKVIQYIQHRFDASDAIFAKARKNSSGTYDVTIDFSNDRFFYTSPLVISDNSSNKITTIERNSATGEVIGTYSNQYKTDIGKALSSYVATQQPLHDFISALNGQSSKGAEINIGYKFRNYNSSSFIAPQIDFSYFNAKPSRTFYANSTSTSFSTTQDATHTNKSTKDFFDASYAAGLTTRMGLELKAHFGSVQVPFSVYGLFGGVGTQRNYENAKFKSFGLKYGAGGEIFVSRNLAVFGEFYQIDFLNTNVSNTQEVTAYKIAVTEQFKLKSNLKAIKVGLTYYFW